MEKSSCCLNSSQSKNHLFEAFMSETYPLEEREEKGNLGEREDTFCRSHPVLSNSLWVAPPGICLSGKKRGLSLDLGGTRTSVSEPRGGVGGKKRRVVTGTEIHRHRGHENLECAPPVYICPGRKKHSKDERWADWTEGGKEKALLPFPPKRSRTRQALTPNQSALRREYVGS